MSINTILSFLKMCKVLRVGLDYTQRTGAGVVYGMWPTRPETGYGYIQLGEKISGMEEVDLYKVAAFKEKPDLKTATRYQESKKFLWNAGIFVWKVSELLREIHINLPELAEGLEKLRPFLGTRWSLQN